MALHWALATVISHCTVQWLPLCVLGAHFGLTCNCPWHSAEMDKFLSLGIVLKK